MKPGDRAVRIELATSADRPAWDAFVAARPEGDPLQLWAWGDVRDPDGEHPVRLLALGPDRRIRGVASLLVRATSFDRTVGYVPHGPLWEREAPDADEILGGLLDGLRSEGRRRRAIVVKIDPRAVMPDDGSRIAARLRDLGLRAAQHDLQAPRTAILDLLDGADALWKTWDPAARNQARRAVREGVEVVVHREFDASVKAFHGILRSTGERGDFRIQSLGHFERMASTLAAGDGWYLAVASHEGHPISGAVFVRVGDRSFYLYGASLRDPEYRTKYGSNAVMAEGMRVLAGTGATSLDLWGVADPDDPGADPAWAGFSAFKRQFGGTPIRHPGTFDIVVSRLWDTVRSLREGAKDRSVRQAAAGRR